MSEISFSIKNYENNMLVRLAVVSYFNGSFVRKNFAYSAFVIACTFMRLSVCEFQFD